MDHIFSEIRAAIAGNAWILALFGILAIPDICGALGSRDGRATSTRYKAWFDANLSRQYSTIDPGEFYQMRCSFLHQAASATTTYSRTIFIAPGTVQIHNGKLADALVLDLPTFGDDMISAAEVWLMANSGNEPIKSNLAQLVRWHPDGINPYIVGAPVLS